MADLSTRHPCGYCGTDIDEDNHECATGAFHYAAVCLEYTTLVKRSYADELAALRARVVELERERDDVREALGMIGGGVGRSLGDEVRHQCAESTSRRARVVELERDMSSAVMFIVADDRGKEWRVTAMSLEGEGRWRISGPSMVDEVDTYHEGLARARELAGGKGGGE